MQIIYGVSLSKSHIINLISEEDLPTPPPLRYDEVLHKLYTAIHMCEREAFEIDHRQDVLNVKISQQIYKYINGIMNHLNTGQL